MRLQIPLPDAYTLAPADELEQRIRAAKQTLGERLLVLGLSHLSATGVVITAGVVVCLATLALPTAPAILVASVGFTAHYLGAETAQAAGKSLDPGFQQVVNPSSRRTALPVIARMSGPQASGWINSTPASKTAISKPGKLSAIA